LLAIARLISRTWIAVSGSTIAWRVGTAHPRHEAPTSEVVVDLEGDRIWLHVAGRRRPVRLGRTRSPLRAVDVLAGGGAEVVV
jgi:hypothetical protein